MHISGAMLLRRTPIFLVRSIFPNVVCWMLNVVPNLMHVCQMGSRTPQGKGRYGAEPPAKACYCKLQPYRQSYAATWRIQTRSWVGLPQRFRLLPNHFSPGLLFLCTQTLARGSQWQYSYVSCRIAAPECSAQCTNFCADCWAYGSTLEHSASLQSSAAAADAVATCWRSLRR